MTNNYDPESILDPVHANFDFFQGQMTKEIWGEKYKWEEEQSFFDSIPRIVNGVFAKDQSLEGIEAAKLAKEFMRLGLLMPAGRIMAGAGTDKLVTLLNCFVNGKIEDSMKSITEHISYAVLTMQQGGGMGTAFETLRPANATLKRTGKGSRASGPLPFMDWWNTGGITVESAGGRRGAQMGTLSDTHPDLPAFIVAKRTPGRLTNFNISVLISDAFMEAKADDEDWPLYFNVPPINRDPSLADHDFIDDNGVQQYVYAVWKARDLWKLITENTYEYSEPGIIFIDRVNELNNLHNLEDIRATNPCGEQPLPPHNACDLGHVVLARMVRNPFQANATFDFDLLRRVVRVLQRFLDNIWDVTNFPLEQQREECLAKRRTGLGFTGLADVFYMMGMRYGSARSADLAEKIMQTIAEEAYNASVDLAIEKGPFPLFDADQYLAPNTFAGSRLPTYLQDRIRKHGIRNGVLLTIAPTGTSSIVYGNPAGGLEPVFALAQKRKVLQPDKTHKEYVEYPYAVALWRSTQDPKALGVNPEYPSHFITMKDLTIDDHILIQARCQRWVDASISKTTNIPKEMAYDDFVRVYDLAYAQGCKGCTTYRPSDVRGSVLEDASAPGAQTTSTGAGSANSSSTPERITERPDVLHGSTYKIKWPRRQSALYLTINSDDRGNPFEVFLTGKDGSAAEWTTALSLMITGLFRTSRDVSFIADELMQIQSVNDTAFMYNYELGRNSNFQSLPAYIGYLIKRHLEQSKATHTLIQDVQDRIDKVNAMMQFGPENQVVLHATDFYIVPSGVGTKCPNCGQNELYRSEGCDKCQNCGYSHCS
jgi:ribonucleoside-diphosphate reductase alpha chain